MTDQQMIASIITAIQQDDKLILLLRALVTNNIVNVPSDRLTIIMNLLGLS